jgi:hypothetical protein
MNRIQDLQDQIARAERLAMGALDRLTIERLSAFATECRAKIAALMEVQRRRA